MNNNKLIIILLIFSIALNIGIIGYLFYEQSTHNRVEKYMYNGEMSRKHMEEMRKRMSKYRKDRYKNIRKVRFSREDRKKIRDFFLELHKQLKDRIVEQVKLKKELYDSFNNGDIEKAKDILTTIHKNQKEIDIVVLTKALDLIKEFPKDKRKIVSIMIFRIIGRRR